MFTKFRMMLIATALVFGSMIFAGCKGDAGATGPAGKDGANGKDGNATCGTCHSNTATTVNFNWAQFEYSKHNTGVIYEEEGGRIACGGCHTSEGFIEAATKGVDDPTVNAEGKLTCRTCHTIHSKYDSTDFALRITAGFKLRQSGVMIDQKTGNLCSKCHQARAYVRTTPDTIKPASKGTSYSRLGPHYGVVANVMTMNGLYPIAGNAALPTENKHASLPDGCVSCHMGYDPSNPAVGGHTFDMPVANLSTLSTCTTCHDAATMKAAATTTQIGKDILTYRTLLIQKGMLDTTQAVNSDGTYNILGEYPATPGGKTMVYTNPTDIDVLMNYLYIAKDRSKGVHNPKYVQALVKNAIDYLSK